MLVYSQTFTVSWTPLDFENCSDTVELVYDLTAVFSFDSGVPNKFL